MKWALNSNLQAMSIVAAILILMGGTVVGVYHCWQMLGWIAIFPAAGFLFADYLGFHLIFFARKERGLLGWGSLVCKFVIFGTLLLNGASLVFLLITDAKDKAAIASRIEAKKAELEAETAARVKLIEAESAARQAEETRRAQNAAEVAQITGNASLARTVVRASTALTPAPVFTLAAPSPSTIASTATAVEPATEVPGIVERFARWYTRGPLYFSGGLVGLLCFILIQVFGKIGESHTAGPVSGGDRPEAQPAAQVQPVIQALTAVPSMANTAPQLPQERPRAIWRGGLRIDQPNNGERSH